MSSGSGVSLHQQETAPCTSPLTLNQGSTGGYAPVKPPRAPSQRFLQRVQAGKDEFRAGMFSKDSPSWLWEVFLRTRGVTTAIQGHLSAMRAWDCIAVSLPSCHSVDERRMWDQLKPLWLQIEHRCGRSTDLERRLGFEPQLCCWVKPVSLYLQRGGEF